MIRLWILMVVMTIIFGASIFGCAYRDPMPKWHGYQLEFKDNA